LYAALSRLRLAAGEPLFVALDDAHWADPDSLTLLRLICRRIAALPVAVLVTTRPWPPEALRAGEELAGQQLAAVQQLAPLSAGAARSILSGRAGAAGPAAADDVEQAAVLCAGNPLLLDYVAAAMRSGQGIRSAESPGGTSSRHAAVPHGGPARRSGICGGRGAGAAVPARGSRRGRRVSSRSGRGPGGSGNGRAGPRRR
jgi:hypothetical protein